MNASSLIVLALIALATIVETAVFRDGCSLSINYFHGDLKEPQPLLVRYEKNGTSFLYPIDNLGTVKLASGESVTIACPGTGNYIKGVNDPNSPNEIEARCVTGKTFQVSSQQLEFSSLLCKYLPKNEARRTKKRCHESGLHVEIGFNLKNDFLRTIEICRDDETMMTYWSKYHLTSRIDGYQSGFPRPYKWNSGDYYGSYNLDQDYRAGAQTSTIANLVGSRQLANKYLNRPQSLFFARGHLSAKADFVYGAAQMSTFWYLNSAPQWQTFNAGNWNSLEMSVRMYAASSRKNLEVYTGTWGQGTLKDVNGNQVPIYLHANVTSRAFPIPKYFWKVVHDPATQKATAFVSLNDPWTESRNDEHLICENVADKISWVNWQPRNVIKGLSFACDLDDLRKTVPHIPNLRVNSILT